MKKKLPEFFPGIFTLIKAFTLLFLMFVAGAWFPVMAGTKTIVLYSDLQLTGMKFTVAEIEKACSGKNLSVSVEPLESFVSPSESTAIVLSLESNQRIHRKLQNRVQNTVIQPEGFSIRVSGGKNPLIWICAKDEAGLMYGGLELAEVISTSGIGGIKDQTQNPYMKTRGIKFNIPLDVRTPSYSDVSEAAQVNMPEVWNFDFWKRYIDQLARYRYNLISLWNLHPFPSMVKVPEYPDIALDDVHRSTGRFREYYSLNGHGFDDPEIVEHYEVICKMSIDEKIAFWRKVMDYGKQRNIRFYIITWNIFTYGTGNKYGITDKFDNPVTRDYFRKSVRQMLLTYPDLAGIGLTTGENMYGLTSEQKEDWAFTTYGQGVLDVAKEQPGRKITFIHRQHQTGAAEIARQFEPLTRQPNIEFLFSFKYAQAHVYSSVNQVFHQGFVEDIRKNNFKTLWTLRNDDNYYFRWGSPVFVRDFIRNIPYDVTAGFYYGSDNYIWGKDFLSKDTTGQSEPDIQKHWYSWMLWGRLGYNPGLTDERLMQVIQSAFPGSDANGLFEAWQNASMIYPLVTGFHWGALDFQWYIESGKSAPAPAQTPSGYHDVNRFITLEPHKGTGNLSIPEYTRSILSGNKPVGITPLMLADSVLSVSGKALAWSSSASGTGSREYRRTISDIRSMAYLGQYYGHKINAATWLDLYRKTNQPEQYKKAISALKRSALSWRYYASNALTYSNNPVWTNRTGYVDWKNIYSWVLYDLTANGSDTELPGMEPTPGGTILEAESAAFTATEIRSERKGFTGSGYLESREGDAVQTIRFRFHAPHDGQYLLEFRYSLKRQENYPGELTINGKPSGSVDFWISGSPNNWVWDSKEVELKSGENTIDLSAEGWVVMDHLNILND